MPAAALQDVQSCFPSESPEGIYFLFFLLFSVLSFWTFAFGLRLQEFLIAWEKTDGLINKKHINFKVGE
jgi:hypothetical protein